VLIESGYNEKYDIEFTGYITKIESDFPLTIYCEDESYVLRQSKHVRAYKSATLDQVLRDIVPAQIKWDAPSVNIGKYQIDKASGYAVLSDLTKNYGLYSRMRNGVLKVGLAYDFGENAAQHEYVIGGNVKRNELKYKRTSDFNLRFKAVATNANGTKTTAVVGSNEPNASERTLNFAGPMTEAQLREKASAMLKKLVYDGYTGDISGFGLPRTHAGDALLLRDKNEPERGGKYLIEKVEIIYSESVGYERINTLSYKI
jgi:hypothetical protein